VPQLCSLGISEHHMKSASPTKFQRLIQMMEAFVSGESTSPDFVKQMDSEFWACGLNEDERFSDLMTALDLFGVPRENFGSDTKTLASECRYALRILTDEL